MGRGNVCVSQPYEGLYYIDNEHFRSYVRENPGYESEVRLQCDLDYDEMTGGEWHEDYTLSEVELDDILECCIEELKAKFKSFVRTGPSEWISRTRRAILENKLFYVCVEDNEWSVAVELIQKETPYGESWMENLQSRHFQRYLDGIRDSLLERLPEIGTYAGAWTSGRIRKEDKSEKVY